MENENIVPIIPVVVVKVKKTFEECLPIINKEINKRRSKWQLHSLQWLDYEDVAQIIRLHIWKKWDLYNQDFALEPWIAKVISSQTRNLIRNNYSNYARPCVGCISNQGGELCEIFGLQGSACPLYKKWEDTKSDAYNTKLPVSLEFHQNEVGQIQSSDLDVEKIAQQIHPKILKQLKDFEVKVYTYLFIEHKTEQEVAVLMGYKTNEEKRQAGYRWIHEIKKNIIKKVKKLIYEKDEIDFI